MNHPTTIDPEAQIQEPTGLPGVLVAITIWLLTLWIIVAGNTVAAWHRLWFWLTYSVDCATCKRRLHQAVLFWMSQDLGNGYYAPRISHTWCPDCFAKLSAAYQRSAPGSNDRSDLGRGSAGPNTLHGTLSQNPSPCVSNSPEVVLLTR